MTWLLLASATTALALGSMRWLRVAQREHYLPEVGRFAFRWWTMHGTNRILLLVLVLSGVGTAVSPWLILPAAAVVALGPLGLSVKGRTGPLAWTERLRRVAVFLAFVAAVPLAIDRVAESWFITGIVLICLPLLIDGVLAVLQPLEKRLGDKWVDRASTALRQSNARVVAITGSYGKTTTKGLVAHLLAEVTSVVPSPASFNNRMGLARAINEQLSPGTDVFVAEMGTYGPGEIAEMCSWVPPDVAMITAIGPVHLERMKSEEGIVTAKREILADAPVAVLSVDHPLLAALAIEEEDRRRIIRCSAVEPGADVYADAETGGVTVAGRPVGSFDPARAHPGNVACAVGAVVGLGFDVQRVAGRLESLPRTPHRRTIGRSDRGFAIVDDTFNSNPTGARAALASLLDATDGGKAVLVTPGMVEMGGRQYEENRRLIADAVDNGIDALVVVGRTNRRAMLAGAREHGLGTVIVVDTREQAVDWVRGNLGPGDAVLYENDLPDHYP